MEGAEQTYRPDSVADECPLAIIHLGNALLRCSSHLPACSDGPPLTCTNARTHAYLVLLPVEVAAFHPAALVSEETCIMATPMTVCTRTYTLATDSSLWPCSSALSPKRRRRTAVSRYRVLWSPDLPRNTLSCHAIARSAPHGHCRRSHACTKQAGQRCCSTQAPDLRQ